MPNWKPFPLEDQKPKDGFCAGGPNVIRPRENLSNARHHHGTSMLPRGGGTRSPLGPLLHKIVTAEKFERKTWKPSQLKAGYVKFLSDAGWRRARIASFLGVKLSFIGSVRALANHRYVPAMKPPGFGASEEGANA